MFGTWRLAAYAALCAALVGGGWYMHHKGYVAGKAAAEALQAKREAAATAAHEALIAQLDEAHNAALHTLEAQRDTATARVVTRTIRVSVATACPAPGAEDAGVPVAGAATDGLLAVDDPDYGRLRRWLLDYASTATGVGGRADAVVPGGN